jgi:hypothetical protein
MFTFSGGAGRKLRVVRSGDGGALRRFGLPALKEKNFRKIDGHV